MSLMQKLFGREDPSKNPAVRDAAQAATARSDDVTKAADRLRDVIDRMLDENAHISGRQRRDASKPSH